MVVVGVTVVVVLDLVEVVVEEDVDVVDVIVALTQETPEQVYPAPYCEVQNASGN
jgi:hypothetical protein